MWAVNKQFLDNQIAQGKSFLFTVDPLPLTKVPKPIFTALEYQHLRNNGYQIIKLPSGLYKMIK
jgi:filamentous hemagglutinin